jgi:hypothetical protein
VDGTDGLTPTLRDLAVDTIDGLDDVSTTPDGDAAIYARAGRPFAAVTRDELEVRLEPFVATAALRTPDTAASSRGNDWVRFAPSALDRFAADRAVAWIEHAWRHAET